MKFCSLFVFVLLPIWSLSQCDQWQQRVKYIMHIDMNVETNRFTGKQKLEYWNNSPDTLTRLYYHLYFNAFQPGSMMDERSRRQGTLSAPGGRPDWDGRVRDRILYLKPDEIGYQKILSLRMNGKPQTFKVNETILEVIPDKPIPPRTKVTLDMDFEAQVPLQIRRSGRDNPTSKVRYTMTQWYPKICAYDRQGWHATPYVGREFYGVWGDYEVSITIDKNYILGGTGYLQNANQIGYGYEMPGTRVVRPSGNKLTWKFLAPNVHDFAWAADPGYIHKTRKVNDSLWLHLLYKPTNHTAEEWESILDNAVKALPFIEKHFGPYPYKQYSFIHGGDGGMEYPMATMLIGPGAWLHEWMHSWYYGILANNEGLYPWMDEGFTTYAEDRVMAFLEDKKGFPFEDTYRSYFSLARSGREEPLSTHADHYNLNWAYGAAVYAKGAVFLEQLGYITGASVRDKILLEYYRRCKFKHPDPDDFIRIAEKVSQIKLDWYKQYWIYSTKTIDYAIDSLWEDRGSTKIRLRKIGQMPMPVDVYLTFKDGKKEMHYVPMNLMYGEKPQEDTVPGKVYEPWKWTHSTYVIETGRRLTELVTAEIDPSLRMADIDRKNNRIELKW
ncbi:MAG: M1 family metallopeptidase [Chitinophagaceae bacterium]|nr:M1 family metallopeptidase [Chitinophagaceae bacterium]